MTETPATQAQVQKVRADLKGDIEGARSELKADIAGVKSELKADIAGVRSELKGDIERLAVALVRTQDHVRRIEEKMATKADIQRVLTAVDAFARKAEAYDRKSYSHGDILVVHEGKLRDHEKRLGALESGE